MKFSTLASAVALPLLAAATPMPNNPTPTTVTVTATATATAVANQCNSGSLQCCNSVQSSSDPVTALLLGLLGIVLQGVDAQVGVTCSPITGVGVSGTSCTQQTVCCENDSFNGVVAIGCSPININL